MNEKNVQQTVAAALARPEPLSAAECTQLHLQVHNALTSIRDRVVRTAPAGDHAPAGAEYMRALKTGTADDVRKVEEEHEQLRILNDQLIAQRDELSKLRMAAKLREAREGLPRLNEAFVQRLDAVEQANAALKRAVGELTSTNREIFQARRIIQQNYEEPRGGPTLKTLRRLDMLTEVFPLEISRYRNWWMDNLGCAVIEGIVRKAREMAPDIDLSECESDVDVMRAVLGMSESDSDADVMRAMLRALRGADEVRGLSNDQVAIALAQANLHRLEAA